MDVVKHSSSREQFAYTAAFITKTFLLGVIIIIIRVDCSDMRIDDQLDVHFSMSSLGKPLRCDKGGECESKFQENSFYIHDGVTI